MHERFEWDETKADSNRRTHDVSFDLAAEVLADPFGHIFQLNQPQRRKGEDRWFTLASHPERRENVFAIVWTERADEKGPITRIISARKVTKQEQIYYEAQVY